MDTWISDIKKIEFNKIHYDEKSNEYFEYESGSIPVLISAPHGAKHLRDGKLKEEDEYTSSIAIKLAELTNAHVIYVKNATEEDPNHDLENKFKDKIREVVEEHGIKFIADIHGASEARPFKVSVGIRNNEKEKCSCPIFRDVIEDSLKAFQEDIFNLDNLRASHPGRITSFAINTLKVEAAQFEINAKYRIIERKPDSSQPNKEYKAEEDKVLELIETMKEMITNINEKLTNE